MTVREALRRLARHGYWSDPDAPDTREWLELYAGRIRAVARRAPAASTADRSGDDPRTMTAERAAPLLAQPRGSGHVVIRRVEGATVFWYARRVGDLLDALADASGDLTLDAVLMLPTPNAEQQGAVRIEQHVEQIDKFGPKGVVNSFDGVVLSGHEPIGVGVWLARSRTARDPAPPEGAALEADAARPREEPAPVGAPPPASARAAGAPTAPRSAPGSIWSWLWTGLQRVAAPAVAAPAAAAPDAAAPKPAALPKTSVAPAPAAPAVEVRAFPRLDAPGVVAVDVPFDLVVGLADAPVAGVVSTGPLVLHASAPDASIPVDVQVVTDDGFAVLGAARRTLDVAVADPTAASVTFRLVARAGDAPVRITSLVVRFSVAGVARGSAARNVVVARAPDDVPAARPGGQAWLDAALPAPAVDLAAPASAPDVELDILKPDANAAGGSYRCVFRNAHGVPVPDASFAIELGDDAPTFAKTLIDDVRTWSSDPLADNFIANVGSVVADKLPPAFWAMLRAVATRVADRHDAGRPLTLQLNSAEPYVPWELALVDPPLDPGRPPYLSAQVAMGRWVLGDSAVAAPPKLTVAVRAMAVMAGMYKTSSGLRALPQAQEEARALTTSYAALPAVPLDGSGASLKSLLDATLTHQSRSLGGVQAVHFAGHGEVDPTRPASAALYLSDGRPLTSLFFRHSKLGAGHAPFIFLNACMVGTAGEFLGDYGGFPGNCLAGGFTGLVAPLWAVDDDVAKAFALEFYRQALVAGGGRPVAEVLRDLRARYDATQPVSTYLAYVYYGNPRLTLSCAAPPVA